MAGKSHTLSAEALKALRENAKKDREQFAHKPGPDELLTPEERADAAPFYFVLRGFVAQLKKAREQAGLTLAQIAERTGLAPESLSRLETGALPNPTWRTLGLVAHAVGMRPVLSAEPAAAGPEKKQRAVGGLAGA